MSLYELHDFTNFRIERGVDIPERDSNSSRMRMLLEEMDYDDSVELPIALIHVARLSAAAREERFVVREYKNTHGAVDRFRMWKLPLKGQPSSTGFEE